MAERITFVSRCVLWLRTCLIKELGRAGEKAAGLFLRHKGLAVVAGNWYGREGELDLVAVTPSNELVFVEVKTTRGVPGEAWARIDPSKVNRLTGTAGRYLRAHHLPAAVRYRFDVVLVLGDPRCLRGKLRFLWARNVI